MNPVGMIQGNLFDRTRSNWAGDGPRPIGWTAWYPTEAGVAEEDVFIGSYFTMGPVAIEAPLVASPARFPVVLLSHGTGGSAVMMGWIGRRLAQAGFVAIAVDHHGNCGSEPYQAEGFICWWERPADLSVALTELASQSPFEGRLNLNQAFAAGFSLGGYTVLSLAGALTDHSLFEQWLKTQPGFTGPREFPDLAGKLPDLLKTSNVFRQSFDRQGHCYRDPRVKAIYALAPAPAVQAFTLESLRAIDVPVAMMASHADVEAAPQYGALWLNERLPSAKLTMLGDRPGHYVFLCEGTPAGRAAEPEICTDPPGVDRRATHDLAARAAIEHFNQERPSG